MLVRSTKKGKKYTERDVPIFDELFPMLCELWQEQGRPDSGNVIVEHRTPKNVRDQRDGYSSPTKGLAEQHGIKLWPRALQNLRASFVSRKVCLEKIPLATVCKWVEQSEVIAGKHYIVLGDENIAEASTWSVESWTVCTGLQCPHRRIRNTAFYRGLHPPAYRCRRNKYPHGDLNPGPGTENPVSWATRRWGHPETTNSNCGSGPQIA